jgi:integrase
MPLTDTTLRAIKPTDNLQKFFDGGGLFLGVSPSGTKSWRLKFRFAGKEKLLTLGQYPVVSLKEARERAMEAKKILSAGKDPSVEKKHAKQRQQNIFELTAREWHEKQLPVWNPGYAKKVLRKLEKHVFPYIGSRPITDISAPELLAMLRKREARGSIAEAHMIKGICGSVFRYAVASGRAERDPSSDIRGALTAYSGKNYPAIIDPDKVGELLCTIDNYRASNVLRCAMQFLALTFCRSAEVRHAEWDEFDFNDMLWRIPAAKMKMSRDHIVPLSTQAVSILESLRPNSDNAKYVFRTNWTGDNKPIGQTTLISALRRMGIKKEEMCTHGFRAMASTLLNEQGYHADVIERQLAHVPHQRVRGIYNRAEYLPERRKMMQEYADYLDSVRERAKQAAGA